MYYSPNLSFNSDLPMDKVIWLYEGTVTADNYGSWNVTIPHKLAAVPFVKGVWTKDNWSTTWMSNARHADHDYLDIMCDVASDGTNVYFYGSTTSTGATIKYKLWGVWNEKETYSTKADFTKNTSKNDFILNSDYNYPQLVMEGYLEKGKTVTHGLGFVPQCDIWSYEQISAQANGYKQYTDEFLSSSYGNVKLTDTTLSVDGQAYMSKIYYRIYAS